MQHEQRWPIPWPGDIEMRDAEPCFDINRFMGDGPKGERCIVRSQVFGCAGWRFEK